MCMFSLIGNVFVLNLHHRDLRIESEMPKWVINKFFDFKRSLNQSCPFKV